MAGDFTLPNEKVTVKYIERQKGNIIDKKHILYGGLHPSATRKYPPKELENGQMVNVLTNEEKIHLEKLLGLQENDLSVYKKNGYLSKVIVTLGKADSVLNLSDPVDYIKYKILLGYKDEICSDIDSVNSKQTYKFVIVRKDDEAKSTLKKVDVKKEAYKLLGKLEDNREALINFLMVINTPVSEDTSLEWMNAEVGKKLEENPKMFVDILNDPSYSTRVLLLKALAKGEIVRKNSQYYTKDGIALAEVNQPSTLENAVTYLESNMNQEYRLLLTSKV